MSANLIAIRYQAACVKPGCSPKSCWGCRRLCCVLQANNTLHRSHTHIQADSQSALDLCALLRLQSCFEKRALSLHCKQPSGSYARLIDSPWELAHQILHADKARCMLSRRLGSPRVCHTRRSCSALLCPSLQLYKQASCNLANMHHIGLVKGC